jgi:tetratricopeptide (TPR) repeat protein
MVRAVRRFGKALGWGAGQGGRFVARRIQRKELRKPDEFIGVATRILNWIADHRGALGISIGALLVLVFGVMVVTQLRRSANVEDWRPLLAAGPVRAMPKGEATNPLELIGKQDPAIFVDEQKLAKVADAAESEQARALADLAVAGQLLAKGDAVAAEKRYRAYLSSNPPVSSAGRLIAQEGLGYALERQNRTSEAEQAFAGIADLSEGAYRALALYHQGRLLAGQGRDEEARKLLLEAKSIQDPRPAVVVPQVESWLRLIELRSLPAADAGAPQGDAPPAP